MKRGMEFIRLLTEFFDSYLPDTKGVSENTIRSYKAALRIFFIFLEEEKGIPAGKVTFSVLDSSIVDEFLSWIETTRGCSKQTRNQRLAALSSFAKFALRRDVVSAGAFSSCVLGTERKRASKRSGDDVVFFLPEEMQILLSLPNRQTICGRRDVVLMSFLYASGARAQELCDLTANDVTFGVETRVRLVGKGSKARRIVIPNECADLLRIHFKQAGLFYGDKNRHVFSSQRNEHMTISCVEEVVSKYVNMAKKLHPGLFQQKAYTPHAFRHTIAVDMLACGCSLPAIKAFLGHSSIQSTMIYATVTSDQANKILRERGLPAKLPAPEKEKGDEKTDVIWFYENRLSCNFCVYPRGFLVFGETPRITKLTGLHGLS